jgi:putative ABC transport system ATP-binding protein
VTVAAIETHHVTKSFGTGETEVQVLSDVTTSFEAGALTLLVGESGSGKTTLISIIAGILSPSKGQVMVFGTELTALRPADLVRFRLANIGFIFQQYNLMPSLTVAENAAIPLIAAGAAWDSAVKQGRELAARMGLEGHLDKRPNQLSGGQQQRVAIARALVNAPKLLVCDEPTAALDARSGKRVMEVIREIAVGTDRAVIIVTHDNRIFDQADRIVKIEDGRIVRRSNGDPI